MTLRLLVSLTLALGAARAYATARLGFGDAEALYATYALHPQVTYLDHPGLVGVVASWLGHGGAPSPFAAHAVASVLATLTPWFGVAAARGAGASKQDAPLAGLALVAAPEISIGLFGLTPDALLAPMWLTALGLSGLALRLPDGDPRADAAMIAAVGVAGVSTSAKVTGALLVLGLLAAFVRARPRRASTWLAVALACLTLAPLVRAEWESGGAMLRHRLVGTQSQAGVSLRNLGALLGGQLLYLSPLVAVAAALVLFRLGRRLPPPLLHVTIACGVPLVALCSWSRVAEPHWLAPMWLGAALAVAVAPHCLPRRLQAWALATGLTVSALAHVVVLTDLLPRVSGGGYDGRVDLVNDLYTWQRALPAVRAVRAVEELRDGTPPPLVAPHWTVGAQLAAGLGERAVSTTAQGDDFARWAPPETWRDAPAIVWVTDDRFVASPPDDGRVRTTSLSVALERGGRVVRTVRVEVWRHRAASGSR